jgi:hypothetical protein
MTYMQLYQKAYRATHREAILCREQGTHQSACGGVAEGEEGMKFAYADPPYIGQAQRHYSKEELCAEVDHSVLIADLMHYDGWALSLSSPTLKQILALCPDDVRVGAWVKPWASFKPNVNPAYAWEPVIFWGGRKRGRELPTVRDWVSANATMLKGLAGAKPLTFCYWLFEMLGAVAGDELTDIFPGTGIVSRAWENWTNNMSVKNLPIFTEAS